MTEFHFKVIYDDGYLKVAYDEAKYCATDYSWSFYISGEMVAEIQKTQYYQYLWIWSGGECTTVTHSEFRGWLETHYPIIIEWTMFNELDLFRTIMKTEKYQSSD